MIKLQNICKSYQTKTQTVTALNDISIEVSLGEIFGVIGKSGAGKSTLIRCANLLERPDSGTVIIDNINLTQLSETQLKQQRQKIGMIFQHFNLLQSRTAFDNIALPLEIIGQSAAAIHARVTQLLELVDLSDRADYLPSQLSGGQKQRVAIARALANNPRVLLSDEATSALDPESTQSILRLLKKINQELQLTILLITHEMDVIKEICHHVAVLDAGKVVEQGNVIDVFANPQADITKALTQKAVHTVLPSHLAKQLQQQPGDALHPIVRLTFLGKQTAEPILAYALKEYDVLTNILLADLEIINDASIGFTVCQLIGKPKKVAQVIEHFKSLSIQTEVLGYA